MAYTCKNCGAVANEPGHLCNPCGDKANCSFCGTPSVDTGHMCKDKLAAMKYVCVDPAEVFRDELVPAAGGFDLARQLLAGDLDGEVAAGAAVLAGVGDFDVERAGLLDRRRPNRPSPWRWSRSRCCPCPARFVAGASCRGSWRRRPAASRTRRPPAAMTQATTSGRAGDLQHHDRGDLVGGFVGERHGDAVVVLRDGQRRSLRGSASRYASLDLVLQPGHDQLLSSASRRRAGRACRASCVQRPQASFLNGLAVVP